MFEALTFYVTHRDFEILSINVTFSLGIKQFKVHCPLLSFGVFKQEQRVDIFFSV